MADIGTAGGADSLATAIGEAIGEVGAAGRSTAPAPIGVVDRSGAADATLSCEYVVGSDGRIYGAGDEVPDGDSQGIDIELIKSAYGWIAMAQLRGPRRTECVGWSGAGGSSGNALDDLPDGPDDDDGDGGDAPDAGAGGDSAADRLGDAADRLDSLLSTDPKSAVKQALKALQRKGCIAATRPALPPMPVGAAAVAAAEAKRSRGGRKGAVLALLLLLLFGAAATIFAVATRPDHHGGKGSGTGSGSNSGSVTGPGSPSGTTAGGAAAGGSTSTTDCHSFAVAFTWVVKAPAYPVADSNRYAGQSAVAHLSGGGLPSTGSAVVGRDGTLTFGPYTAGDGPWTAAVVSIGTEAVSPGPPTVLSSTACH
jgi:hypothetical protein